MVKKDLSEEKVIDIVKIDNASFVVCENKLIRISKGKEEVIDVQVLLTDVLVHDSSLLFSSKESGLWTFEGGRLRKLYIPGIVFPARISKIKNRNNQMWLLSKKKDLYLYDYENQTIQQKASSVDDFEIDSWNTIWTVSNKMLSKIISDTGDIAPLLTIEQIETGYKRIPLSDPIELSSKQNTLRIRCQAYYSPEPASLTYQLRTEDEEDWIDNGSNSVFTFQEIAAGKQKISIRATAGDMNFSSIHSINIEKKLPLLHGGWPYIFSVLAGLLILSIIMIVRNSIRSRRLNAQKEKLMLELEILRSEQKLGQLRLNPHFLFNALNSISGLIALDKNAEARKQLNAFSQMMRMLLDNSFKEGVSLITEIEFLDKYLGVEQMIRNNKFNYTIENSVKEEIVIPMMILQPFVENAILHGIKYKESRGSINLRFQKKDKYLQAEIQDDGIGREQAGKYRKEGHSSKAIEVIEERLTKLDRWNKQSHVAYTDLYDQEGNPAGTKVILLIPVQQKTWV